MFPALLDKVGEARSFAREVLAGHPSVDSAELIVSELVTNSVLHSLSGEYSASFILGLEVRSGVVRVSVVDLGSENDVDLNPQLPPVDQENGRGLAIVALLAKEWGQDCFPSGQRIWAELVADSAS
ncbi:hypothetical protein Nans01_44860 [Nocardiopsis ansamitocini]|uniref:Histidine kinase/HSP90-like ATPase domain-containing protein n=2 Tax=Nocardiopsis ansamitocini TaxID=1670832 RepID=A0A9W6ULJ3_9ACTN|nr:hypothetical protein Nans01_44860 [Nocardiopsis ansamitocini]